MCFGPQQRALFQLRTFQKWSGRGVLWTFWLGNVHRAKTACNFASLIWLDGPAPAALASLLFDPEPQIIGKRMKTQWTATFLPFFRAHLLLLSYHSFSSLIFSLFLFSSLALPTSGFPYVHSVGSLTSKLLSTIFFLDLPFSSQVCSAQ